MKGGGLATLSSYHFQMNIIAGDDPPAVHSESLDAFLRNGHFREDQV